MGVLRTFLALSVLNSHYRFWDTTATFTGAMAVYCFFVISGFYMALVLDTRYRNSLPRFYLNRALRLYPTYWFVLSLSVLLYGYGPLQFLDQYSKGDWAAAYASNVLLFPAPIAAAMDGFTYSSPWSQLALGQMYTVGMELIFYALAPWIVKQSDRTFAGILALFVASHFAPLWMGLPPRPWQYEFVPSVVVFFLLGVAAYRWIHCRIAGTAATRAGRWGWLALPGFIGLQCVLGVRGQQFNSVSSGFFYAYLALLIPILFSASQSTKWDERIGDLSYPIYVSHFLIMAWAERLNVADVMVRHRLALVVVLVFSAVLVVLIERPLQRVRERQARLGAIGRDVAPLRNAPRGLN